MDVFAGDLLFCVASNELRLPDVGLSVLAKANVPKAEHRAQRSEHGAQLVAARYWLWATAATELIPHQTFIVAVSQIMRRIGALWFSILHSTQEPQTKQ